jgi:hypothetical protein
MILAEAYDITGNTANNKFTDVNSRYLAAVSALKDNGITSGKTETRFGTNDAITRGELAIWVYKLETLNESTVSNLNVAVDGSKATVTADVKNVEENTDATVSVYPNGNLSATPIVNSTKVVAGKVTTTFNDVPAGTHTVVVKVGEVEASKSFVISAAATPKVESVTAINANEIKITFNKELNKASAETLSNYSIDTALLTGNDVVTLNADKKSVTIQLGDSGVITGGLLANNNAYEIAAIKGLLAADETSLPTTQSKTILFSDKAAPVLNTISSLENGDIVMSFNERLNEEVKPYIVLNEVAVDNANVTVNDDGTVTIDALDPAVDSLETGKSYTAVVSGAEDLIGNSMSLVTKTFTYTVKNEEPTLLTATADGETSIELEFDEELSAALVDGGTVKVFKGSTLIAASVDSDENPTFVLGLDYDDVFTTTETSANITVVVEGYKDVQGNLGQKITKTVVLKKDVTKPTVTKTSYDANTGLVTLTFSEGLDAAAQAVYAPKLFVTDVNGVKYDVELANDPTSTELVTVADVTQGAKTIAFNANDFANGTYTLNLQSGAFTDEANTANGIATTAVNFTKGVSSDSDAPTFDFAAETVKGQFVAVFSEPVKGGAVNGSATALANYKLNGAALPVGTTIYLNEEKTVATITLPENTVATSGVKLLTISNVQDLSGKVMDETTRTVGLTENTNPVLKSAKVVTNSALELTFSENVNDATALDFTDFEVTVNGVAVTEGIAVTPAPSANNKFVISVTDANLATGTIVVKVAEDANATDASGNELVTGTAVTATR